MKIFKIRKSFTLIEVVLASTVLILFTLAGISIFNGAMRGTVTSKNYLQAGMIGNKVLEEARAQRDSTYYSATTGVPAFPTTDKWAAGNYLRCYNMTTVVERTGTCTDQEYSLTMTHAAIATDLMKFDVVITWKNYSTTKTLKLYTYISRWQTF